MLYFFQGIYHSNVGDSFEIIGFFMAIIYVSIGLWMTNFVILGLVWISINIISFFGKKRSKNVKDSLDSDKLEEKREDRRKENKQVLKKKKRTLLKKKD